MLRIEDFELERSDSNNYLLRWPANNQQMVRRVVDGISPNDLTHEAVVDNTAATASVNHLDPGLRHYFLIELDDGRNLLLTERRIRLRGAHNFRDFGGYVTASGQHVRWGQLFRSDQLNRLDEVDHALLKQIGLHLICDFRHDAERDLAPNQLATLQPLRVEHLSIIPGSAANIFSQLSMTSEESRTEHMIEVMIEINRDLALQQRPAYKKMFELLAEQDGPLLIHCAAGKDRTGFGAALILSALGVNEETLVHDYLLTERYLPIEIELKRVRDKYQLNLPDNVLRPMLEVRREYLRGALDAAQREFGSLDIYLHEGLGVDAQMRNHLRGRLLQ